MISFYTKYISNICHSFELDTNIQNSKNITFITGAFGTGKSNLVEKIENELVARNIVDAVIKFDDAENISFLTEFIRKALDNFYSIEEGNIEQFSFSETNYNLITYNDLLNKLNNSNQDLTQLYLKHNVLRAYSDISNSNENIEDTQSYIKAEIEALFQKKGERRLILENQKVVVESLLVDLMSYFFADIFNSSENVDLSNIHKRKIVFIIDNYEYIFGSVNQWLAEFFFHYCYDLNFGDFINYKIDVINPQAKISDFFDFRFIIATRENLSDFLPEYFINYSEMAEIFRLEPMTEVQFKNYLEAQDIQLGNCEKDIYEITSGIPSLISYTLETISQIQGEFNCSLVYLFAYESILKHKSEEQKEWIKCASFLNEIEPNALRCFPLINKEYKRAYNYLSKSTELSYFTKNSNKLKLNKVIKKYISEAVKVNSMQIANIYEEIAASYNNLKDFLNKYDNSEIEILKELAYFKCFNVPETINEWFGENKNAALELIDKYPDLFNKNIHTYSLRQDISNKLIKFNKLIERDLFEQKINNIKKYWSNYSNSIFTQNTNFDEKQKSLLTELNKIQEKVNENEQIINDTYDSIDNLDNELKKYSDKFKKFNIPKQKKYAGYSLSIAAISIFFKIFVSELFSEALEFNTLATINLYSNIFAITFTLIFLFLFVRIYMLNSNKKDISFFKLKISGLKDEIKELQDKIEEKQNENKELEVKVNEIENQIVQTKELILKNNEFLKESYV